MAALIMVIASVIKAAMWPVRCGV
ncbi:hypothetical protein C370_07302 [Cryptococcus neoformans A1-35-8]|nr:hypothetical protein C369_07256 [Cryptococcus neoformans var. grubii A5-35-17]OXH00500.1 hypothetical protein C370_07302 [Cryptococcus neoformans var. grubii A1-35-8]